MTRNGKIGRQASATTSPRVGAPAQAVAPTVQDPRPFTGQLALRRAVGDRAARELLDAAPGQRSARLDLAPGPPDAASVLAADRKKLLDAARTARASQPPPATVPGNIYQQHQLIDVESSDLWKHADVQKRMSELARETEEREAVLHPGGKVTHTAVEMMRYWRIRFIESVEYILTERPRGDAPSDPSRQQKRKVPIRDKLRKQLALDEAKIIASAPADQQVAEVEAARARIQRAWDAEIERAIEGYLTLAKNESRLLTRNGPHALPVVLGLPERLERERDVKSAPAQIQVGSAPVAESVVQFMEAIQAESRTKAQAFNYGGHEIANPHFEPGSIGKYSFDIMLPFATNTEGFYDTARTIEFFLAVERASVKTKIEWNAFYNDAEVVIAVNDSLGKGRVAFSGGGNAGKYHHGPDPYILHAHFNIMPLALKERYVVDQKVAEKLYDEFLRSVGARF